MSEKEKSQTAYQYNSYSSSSLTEVDHGWSNAINRMIDQRYAFLALQYESDGYLFRGMSCGLFNALLENQFWHYAADDRGSNFEKDLDVLLVSQDFSDAFTISKTWEQKIDACIIVFKSDVFNNALKEKKAAMMATAEPGVVFKYPFFSRPLKIEEIEYLIVSPFILDIINNNESVILNSVMKDIDLSSLVLLLTELYNAGKLLFLEDKLENNDRGILEKYLTDKLQEKSIIGAKTLMSSMKPTRIA
jgi:hypothetical protein